MTKTTRSATFGGQTGASFDDSHDIDSWGRITQILVRHGAWIDAIGVGYANGNFLNHGGTTGSETLINLGPDERITGVDGRFGKYVQQITLHSTRTSYGPYGGTDGTPFNVNFDGATLQYLFGRSGAFLDQVAFGFGDAPPALPSTIVRSDGHGGQTGVAFDDLATKGSLLGQITSIKVQHGAYIDNIAVTYGNGPAMPHGGGGGSVDTFDLTADEWITEVHGRSGAYLNQVQFWLNSGRVSPVYGGTDGTPFVEKRDDSVVMAIFGRSGAYVDQLGLYFGQAKPTKIEILQLTYDINALSILTLPPNEVMTTFLTNQTSSAQQISQSTAVAIADASTTSVAETNSFNVSFTASLDFKVEKNSLTIGYTRGETTTTQTSHTKTTTYTVNFSAMVPANSRIVATCVAAQSTFDVPWTATANVTYQNRPAQRMTLHGTLKGVATTAVTAEYHNA